MEPVRLLTRLLLLVNSALRPFSITDRHIVTSNCAGPCAECQDSIVGLSFSSYIRCPNAVIDFTVGNAGIGIPYNNSIYLRAGSGRVAVSSGKPTVATVQNGTLYYGGPARGGFSFDLAPDIAVNGFTSRLHITGSAGNWPESAGLHILAGSTQRTGDSTRCRRVAVAVQQTCSTAFAAFGPSNFAVQALFTLSCFE